MTDLAKKVDEASMNEPVLKVGHDAVSELFKAWAGFGKLGEKDTEVMPCSLPTHHPKAGIGQETGTS